MKLILAFALTTGTAAFTAPHVSFTSRFSSTTLDANIVDTLASLEGPGQVWGADGIAVGKEESDLKGYDNFGLFSQRLASSGIAATLAGPGPFTVFAPTDTAIESYERVVGPVDASVVQYCIVPGQLSSAAVATSPLTTMSGQTLTYSRKFRKDFVNDAIIGEKTFGGFSDFPTDVACDNGIIHTVGVVLEP